MIGTPRCFERKCRYYIGVDQPDGTERTERIICAAYPEGIPGDISYGDDLHLEVREDQGNEIVYDKSPDPERDRG